MQLMLLLLLFLFMLLFLLLFECVLKEERCSIGFSLAHLNTRRYRYNLLFSTRVRVSLDDFTLSVQCWATDLKLKMIRGRNIKEYNNSAILTMYVYYLKGLA